MPFDARWQIFRFLHFLLEAIQCCGCTESSAAWLTFWNSCLKALLPASSFGHCHLECLRLLISIANGFEQLKCFVGEAFSSLCRPQTILNCRLRSSPEHFEIWTWQRLCCHWSLLSHSWAETWPQLYSKFAYQKGPATHWFQRIRHSYLEIDCAPNRACIRQPPLCHHHFRLSYRLRTFLSESRSSGESFSFGAVFATMLIFLTALWVGQSVVTKVCFID